MNIEFEWDRHKAEINQRKHHISFETAALVFADPNAFSQQDRFEKGEYRWQTIGMVNGHLILLVAHTVQNSNNTEIIRIISARKATAQERRKYEQYR